MEHDIRQIGLKLGKGWPSFYLSSTNIRWFYRLVLSRKVVTIQPFRQLETAGKTGHLAAPQASIPAG